MALAIGAVVLSTAALALLCRGDPKRLRALRRKGGGHGGGLRWLLAGLVVLPGLALALAGDGAAFMVWLGAIALTGWVVTLAASPRAQDGPQG